MTSGGGYHRTMASNFVRALLLGAVLAGAVACKKKQEPVPTTAQLPIGVEGASCYSGPCNAGLACTPTSRRCARPDDPEILAAQERDRARERMFLRESGVTPSDHAEQPAAPPPPAAPSAETGAVRIVRVATQGTGGWVVAACRSDERLISGGCTLNEPDRLMMLPSYPESASTTDTIGARWSCGRRDWTLDLKIEAFALCQRL